MAVIADDLNGDAKIDLAVANYAVDTVGAVSVFLGDGSGGFTSAPLSPYTLGYYSINPLSGGWYTYALAAGNFFGHSTPDLATANFNTNTIALLSGSSIPTFRPMSYWLVGSGPNALVIGDFNNDGNMDVAVTGSDGQLSISTSNNIITVLLGNGEGRFVPPSGAIFGVGARPSSIAVADFNGDGNLDLAVANNGSNNVTLLLGDGTGNFTQASASPFGAGTQPTGVISGDFNGDGNQDLAISNAGSNNVTVLLGDGKGGFNPAPGSPVNVGAGPNSLTAADFNRDGNLDVAVANTQDGTATVLLGNGSGGFAPDAGSPYSVGPTARSIAAGNFNGDGKPDLAITSFGTGTGDGTVTVLLNGFPQPAGPSITSVQNAASFETTLAPNTYAVIFGQNLSTTNPGRTWTTPDFTTNSNGTLNMPTSLDGTSVTIGGKRAYVSYISPGQINVITPPGVSGENVPAVVTVNGQSTLTFNATIQNLAPSFFTWQPDTSDFGKYLIAQHADYTNVGKLGLFPGTPANFTTPAKPGETITLWATGFGPTSPAIASGIETDKLYNLSPPPAVSVNQEPATVTFAGLIPGLSEVYQLNVTIPADIRNGDWTVSAVVNGQTSPVGLITVEQ